MGRGKPAAAADFGSECSPRRTGPRDRGAAADLGETGAAVSALRGPQPVPAPLPASGSARSVTRFTEVWDKGKAAVIVSETSVTDLDGTPLWSTKRSIFARGEGGFGGERGPSTNIAPPERAPDLEVPLPILPQQALLYRLCGDRNPLHSDPEFAAAAGFPRPILHGLCTYILCTYMVCKATVDTFMDSPVSRVRRYGARFAGVVSRARCCWRGFWHEENGRLVASVTAPTRDDEAVLSDVELIPV